MNKLILIELNSEQIQKAKDVNDSSRRRITHALVFEVDGEQKVIQFGTEKWCLKYFKAWPTNVKAIDKTEKSNDYFINDYQEASVGDVIFTTDDKIRQKEFDEVMQESLDVPKGAATYNPLDMNEPSMGYKLAKWFMIIIGILIFLVMLGSLVGK